MRRDAKRSEACLRRLGRLRRVLTTRVALTRHRWRGPAAMSVPADAQRHDKMADFTGLGAACRCRRSADGRGTSEGAERSPGARCGRRPSPWAGAAPVPPGRGSRDPEPAALVQRLGMWFQTHVMLEDALTTILWFVLSQVLLLQVFCLV